MSKSLEHLLYKLAKPCVYRFRGSFTLSN